MRQLSNDTSKSAHDDITITMTGGGCNLSFTYDPEIIAEIRNMDPNDRKFSSSTKLWVSHVPGIYINLKSCSGSGKTLSINYLRSSVLLVSHDDHIIHLM